MALPKNMYIGMIVLTLSLFILVLSDYLFDILDALILILVFLVILFFIGREEQKIDAYNGESTKSLSLLKIGLLLIVGVIHEEIAIEFKKLVSNISSFSTLKIFSGTMFSFKDLIAKS